MSAAYELQEIVDDLGRRLSRSVALDDTQLRLLAHSPHYGPVDATRLGSILQRVAEGPSAEHVLAQGIGTARGPVRVPAVPDLDLLARACLPVDHDGHRLGFLWLIDADDSLTDDELRLADAAARAAAEALHRSALVHDLERGRERELLRDLLVPEPELRRAAASQLVEEDLLVPGPVVALVVRRAGAGGLADDAARTAYDEALAEARRRLPSRQALHLLRHDHGLVLVSALGRLAGAAGAASQRQLASEVRDDVRRRVGSDDGRTLVGVGGAQPTVAGAATSYEQAVLAARVVQHVGSADDVARWDELGVYRTLARLPADQLAGEALDPAYVRLVEADDDGTFVHTLETYLDLAGNTARTAETLQVHRASVYYRLGRIREITGLDLDDGNSRLALHLALKIARLATPP